MCICMYVCIIIIDLSSGYACHSLSLLRFVLSFLLYFVLPFLEYYSVTRSIHLSSFILVLCLVHFHLSLLTLLSTSVTSVCFLTISFLFLSCLAICSIALSIACCATSSFDSYFLVIA